MTHEMWDITSILVLSYLAGSIPFGLLLGKLLGVGDIRTLGSGNIGATNALRMGGKTLGMATLLCDLGKGAAPVMGVALFYDNNVEMQAVAAVAAFCGHVWPVWLRGRGGKGVATGLGALLAFSWPLGGLMILQWLLVLLLSRHASIAALVTYAMAPLYVWLTESAQTRGITLAVLVFMALIVWWRHRDNMARLRAGTEPGIGDP